jgi:hypothetical protein
MEHPILKLRAVTLLIFFPRPAGTRIVPPHFLLSPNDLLHLRRVSRTSHTRLLEFAALAAHEGFFQFIG